MKKETTLENIASELRGLGAQVVVSPYINGLRVDLLAQTPKGQRIVVEIKNWRRLTDVTSAKASNQAKLYRRVIESEHAFVVIPSMAEDRSDENIFNIHGLLDHVKKMIDEERKFRFMGSSSQELKLDDTKSGYPSLFVAMPFAPEFDDTFFLGFAYAAEKVGAVCIRVDQEIFDGSIIEEIHEGIRRADGVVADLTGANPNVMYEVGFAHALDKPTLHITASSTYELPFDVKTWRSIKYSFGQIHKLRDELIRNFEFILNEGKN